MNDVVLKNSLRIAREEKRLTQECLAEQIGVTRQTINLIERGSRNTTVKLALRLCLALDKKFEELFYFEYSDEKSDATDVK